MPQKPATTGNFKTYLVLCSHYKVYSVRKRLKNVILNEVKNLLRIFIASVVKQSQKYSAPEFI